MLKNKRIRIFLSILFSVLLTGQNFQVAYAGARSTTLTLEKSTMDLSVIDPSKNKLHILNASRLSNTITIKPAPKTLRNGKPIKIQGTLNDDGALEIDLSTLGPANLLPKGTYQITATSGKKKLKGQVVLNPPTLIIGRAKVPIPDTTGEVKARILRHQEAVASGEPITEETTASEIPDAEVALYDINHEPIEDVATVEVPGTEALDENGNPVLYYQLISEIPDSVAEEVENPVIKAQIEAPTSTGTEEVTLSAIAFTEDATANNVINNVVDAATTAAVNIATATVGELEDAAPKAEIPLQDTYDTIVAQVEPATENAETVDEALQSVETACAVHSTEIYGGIVDDLASVLNNPEQIAEIASEVAWKAPEIVGEDPTQIAEQGISNIPFNTYATGFFNEGELGEGVPPPPPEIQALAYIEAGVIPGSIEATSEETLVAALKSGSFPPAVFRQEALQNFGELVNLAKQGELGTFNASQFNKIPIPPGIQANLTGLAEQAMGLAFQGQAFTFEAAPGSFLEGDFESQEGFELFAYPGAFMPPNIAGTAQLQSSDRQFQYPSGFVPPTEGQNGEFTASFMPPTIAQNFNQGSFGIFGSMGIEQVQGNVFALNTGRQGDTLPPPTGSIQFFDPMQHASKLADAFSSLGSNATQYFEGAAVYLAGAFNQGTPSSGGGMQGPPSFLPQGIFDLAMASFDTGQFTASPATVGLGDVIGSFTPPTSTGGPSSGFPGGGATGGTFPGGGATDGAFPGGFDFGIFTGGSNGSPFSGMGTTAGGTSGPGGFTEGTTTGGMPPPGGFTGGTTTTGGMPPPGGFTGGTTTTGGMRNATTRRIHWRYNNNRRNATTRRIHWRYNNNRRNATTRRIH
ncbi:MAG: hypothetical protein HYY52_05235 [Candidatus Melainabacteria bacterium]|nr:hypothetical protein [Candidatus Melainabacteria bacterium]